MSTNFILLQVYSWLAVGFIYLMWLYNAEDAAYKYGKLVLAFLVGSWVGMWVV